MTTSRDSLVEKLTERASNYFDIVVDPKTTTVAPDHNSVSLYTNKEVIYLTQEALTQFLAKIGIPTGFFKKCPEDIQTKLLQHFHGQRKRSYLARCFWAIDEVHCRGILSTSWPTEMDNVHSIPPVVDIVLSQNGEIHYYEHSLNFFRVDMMFTDTVVTLDGVSAQAGIAITNSETGHSSFWIDPVIKVTDNQTGYSYRLSTRSHGVDMGYRFMHTASQLKSEEVLEAVKSVKEMAQVAIVQFFEQSHTKVSTKEALQTLENIPAVPRRFLAQMEEEYQDVKEVEKLVFVKRILRAAEDLPLIQRLQVEHGCTNYLGVFQGTGARLAKIASELDSLGEE